MGRKPNPDKATTKKPKTDYSKLYNLNMNSHLTDAELKKLAKMADKYDVEAEVLVALAIRALIDGRIELATRQQVYLKPLE